ncbi:ice-binding family protein [Pseudarthrobacter sp. DSP2-3-2b1]|uniref:ice-binding family protein n=1 Tax=Pseudarthrobacter sp. DSP2-3-2b1 TaxID=2804661 RepID=UPI003CF9F3EF
MQVRAVQQGSHQPIAGISHRRKAATVGGAAGVLLLAVGLLWQQSPAFAATSVGLGTAASYSVLAGTTVTNTGPSSLQSDLGVSPGTAITGFPPGVAGGAIHRAGAVALQAQSDVGIAYDNAAGQAATTSVSGDLVGRTLTEGVYNSTSSLALTGQLTLDGQGNPNSVFVFQVASALDTASASSVILTNGAQACNVFWQVGSSATLGTVSTFKGTILALTSITVQTGATVEGRALARNGQVSLDTNVFRTPVCTTTPATSSPATTGSPSATGTPTDTVSATATPTTTTTVSATPTTTTTVSATPTATDTSTATATPTVTETLAAGAGGTSTTAPTSAAPLAGTGNGPGTGASGGRNQGTNVDTAAGLSNEGAAALLAIIAGLALTAAVAVGTRSVAGRRRSSQE